MLARFSLYGFLKNQRYFEPFLILVFLEKGFDFLQIGLLIAFREFAVNLLEIPSGAAADVYGRRRTMILSLAAYVVSFLVFAAAVRYALFFAAMFFFAVGDAFRSGTHKAMIFEWLRLEGRTDERTRVYGYTRSWSKLGSALSVFLAAICVAAADSYTWVFYFSIVPYALGIVNLLGYPVALDGDAARSRAPREVVDGLRRTLGAAVSRPGLRRLMLETMGFEGVFHAVKDYLQPVLQALVLSAWATGLWQALSGGFLFGQGGGELSEIQKTAFLIGPVYFVLHLLSAYASRRAHRLVTPTRSEDGAARLLWLAATAVYAGLAVAGLLDLHLALVLGLVLLHVLQNVWRPILISRFDEHGDAAQGATVLSVESQARRLSTIALAPLLGWLVDLARASETGDFWPLGVVGFAAAALCFATAPTPRRADRMG